VSHNGTGANAGLNLEKETWRRNQNAATRAAVTSTIEIASGTRMRIMGAADPAIVSALRS